MRRQPYFAQTNAERPEWFGNYATELPLALGELRVAYNALFTALFRTPT